jgi:hypothetical protein
MMDSGAMNLAGLLQEEDPGVERFVYHPDATEQKPVSWGQIRALIKNIRAGEYGAALFGESSHAWWRPGKGLASGCRRMTMDMVFRPERCVQKLIPWILYRNKVPFVVVDRNDRPKIDPACFLLYGLSSIYFMRELPPRRLDLFPNQQEVTGVLPLAAPQTRLKIQVPVRTEKLRPIALGIWDKIFAKCAALPVKKTIDVFWAGKWNTNETRRRWVEELHQYAPPHWKIKTFEQVIPHEEYLRLCGESRLVLSPPGRGWDCYRHYEVAACGSVPLMSYPTIERELPLVEGEHGFYFAPEPGGLARCLKQLEAANPDFTKIGLAARSHIDRHHRWSVQSDRMRRTLENLCSISA